MDRFWSKVDRSDGCWLWRGFTRDGYGRFWIDGKPENAHRVAWLLSNGAIPDGLMVLHRCDVRACVRPEHLYLGTHNENMADMKAKGRAVSGNTPLTAARGSRCSLSKLSDLVVLEIKGALAAGTTHRAIAAKLGISHSTVGAISRRKTWRHL